MSHHFDSKLGRENPGFSICDMCLFSGSFDSTVMAMTASADVGLYGEDRFRLEAFDHHRNDFRNRNVMALVLEVPNHLGGTGKVGVWATTSLFSHAPEVQVYRRSLPRFTNLFLSDPATPHLSEVFHETTPEKDVALFAPTIGRFALRLASTASSTGEADVHGEKVASRLCPAILPYEMGTPATFSVTSFNGRPLGTDAFDVMLTISAN